MKGIFFEQKLSEPFRLRASLQSGNVRIAGDLRDYSSFIRLPLSLSARFGVLSLGFSYTNTLVSTYEKPSYAVSALEPLIGLGGEWGDLTLGLEGSYPLLETMLPFVLSGQLGVRF